MICSGMIYLKCKNRELMYNNQYYQIDLPKGWIYSKNSEMKEKYVVFSYRNTINMTVEVSPESDFDINTSSTSIAKQWLGMHYYPISEEEFIREDNYIILKVFMGQELSAAESIQGDLEPKNELHYYVLMKNKTFIDIHIYQDILGDKVADDIVKSILIK